jgi:hypothetical protein
MSGHTAWHGHSWVLTTCLLLLEVLVVGHLLLLLGGHVVRVHSTSSRHSGLLSWDSMLGGVFGGVGDISSINTILVAGWFGSIQTGLEYGISRVLLAVLAYLTYLDEILSFWLGH